MPTEEQTYREGIKQGLKDLKEMVGAIDVKVTYTNGKVKKITLALTLLGGVVVGQALTGKEIISILLHIL